ncbi:MAG TPA: hypothetical protein VFV50_09345 [Bdellovibrionales bacterium]|nr:hypothetical protein [Bdellovibrionales bacterium]
MLRAIGLSILLMGSTVLGAQHPFPLVPNAKLTPGSLCTPNSPDFEGYRYSQKIPYCRRSVTYEQKQIVYDAYRIPHGCRRNYTVDHLIPLSIGGSNQFENLWPEHHRVKQTRISFEDEIHMQVRDGQMSQQSAVQLVYKVKLRPAINPKDAFSNCN